MLAMRPFVRLLQVEPGSMFSFNKEKGMSAVAQEWEDEDQEDEEVEDDSFDDDWDEDDEEETEDFDDED